MSLSDHPIHHINSAFILAGGKGERLGILSKKIQKCMLRYAEYPLLEHLIRKFKSVGVEKIVLILDHLSSKTIDYFKDGKEWEIDIKYVNKYYASTSLALSENLDMGINAKKCGF